MSRKDISATVFGSIDTEIATMQEFTVEFEY